MTENDGNKGRLWTEGELEQIQFLVGHASVQTTERYLGCKQNLSQPVNEPIHSQSRRAGTGARFGN
jgi:hypothetical protein